MLVSVYVCMEEEEFKNFPHFFHTTRLKIALRFRVIQMRRDIFFWLLTFDDTTRFQTISDMLDDRA